MKLSTWVWKSMKYGAKFGAGLGEKTVGSILGLAELILFGIPGSLLFLAGGLLCCCFCCGRCNVKSNLQKILRVTWRDGRRIGEGLGKIIGGGVGGVIGIITSPLACCVPNKATATTRLAPVFAAPIDSSLYHLGDNTYSFSLPRLQTNIPTTTSVVGDEPQQGGRPNKKFRLFGGRFKRKQVANGPVITCSSGNARKFK